MTDSRSNVDGGDSDAGTYIRKLEETEPLAAESIVREAIGVLELPAGSRGLDAGCGIGLQAILLAEAVGPSGHVTGLDISPDLLRHAEGIVSESGVSDRVSFQAGDVHRLTFDDDSFDWVWSANCVGYAPFEPLPLVKELVRVTRPGGKVALLAWSSQQFLPGHPRLEAVLYATSSGIAPFRESMGPGSHFLRALGWMGEAGLEEFSVKTFVDDFRAPLSEKVRTALISLFDMRWVNVETELSEEDAAEYRRLLRPESPDFILNLEDYYAFFTCTLFSGKVPG